MPAKSPSPDRRLKARHPWSRVVRTFAPGLWPHRGALLAAYTCSGLAVLATALLPWPLKLVIDHMLGQQPIPGILAVFGSGLSPQILVVVIAGAAAAIAVGGAIFSALEKNINARVRERMCLELRDRLLAHIQTLPLFLDTKHRSGEIMLRLVDDTNQVVRLLAKTAPNIFRQIATTLVLVAVMFYLQPLLGLAGLVVVGVLVLLARHYAAALRRASRDKRLREGEVSGLAAEIMRGLPSIQVLSAEERTRQRFTAVSADSLRAGVRATRVSVGMERSMEFAKGAAIAMVVGGGGLLVLGGDLTVGGLTVCAAYITQLLRPVAKMNELASTVARAFTRGEQLLALLDRRPAVSDHCDAVPIKQARGALELRAVSFAYPAAAAQHQPQAVLRDVNLRLQPGSLSVLVGPSGVGKSTLLSLLLRLFDPDSGEILLDGTPYSGIQLRSLRNQFAVMLQSTHLFAGTVREALQPVDRPTSDQELWTALAQVALDDFARAAPGELDATLGEDGVNLSGGQRARLSLARALLMERPILLLDEPLANVDAESQTIILDALEVVRAGRTCLAVTHQPILTERADVVLELKDCCISTRSVRPVPGRRMQTR